MPLPPTPKPTSTAITTNLSSRATSSRPYRQPRRNRVFRENREERERERAMLERPAIRYLSYALMMVAQLPLADPVRSSSERSLLRRLEVELLAEDEGEDESTTPSASSSERAQG